MKHIVSSLENSCLQVFDVVSLVEHFLHNTATIVRTFFFVLAVSTLCK
jgi:hypothetical protein